jgi:hypothetical protein
MVKIIYDPVYNITELKRRHSRFQHSIEMSFITTEDKDIVTTGSCLYPVSKMTCCSPVKDTNKNWFYLFDRVIDMDLFLRWIEEIKPVFPSLNIDISKINIKQVKSYYDTTTDSLTYNNNSCVKLPFSGYTIGRYGITNKQNSIFGYFRRFHLLEKNVVSFFVTEKVVPTRENINELINKFIVTTPYSVEWYLYDAPMDVEASIKEDNSYTWYHIRPQSVDLSGITLEYFKDYLVELFTYNLYSITFHIRKLLGIYIDEVPVVRVQYSNRDYILEPYLAHILIRVCMIEDMIPFIQQYFLIKEKTPGIFFWHRIFLTQFGFNTHPYYWLTGERIFSVISPEKFNLKLHGHPNTSVNEFFYQLRNEKKFPENYQAEEYKKGDFLEVFRHIMGLSFKVALKEKNSNKFDNLKLKVSYPVSYYNNSYYFIIGDDYKARRYRKDNFTIIEENFNL